MSTNINGLNPSQIVQRSAFAPYERDKERTTSTTESSRLIPNASGNLALSERVIVPISLSNPTQYGTGILSPETSAQSSAATAVDNEVLPIRDNVDLHHDQEEQRSCYNQPYLKRVTLWTYYLLSCGAIITGPTLWGLGKKYDSDDMTYVGATITGIALFNFCNCLRLI